MSQRRGKMTRKSKITAQQRLTVPLGFLQAGASSGYVQKRHNTQEDLRRAVLTERLDLLAPPLDQSQSIILEIEKKWTRYQGVSEAKNQEETSTSPSARSYARNKEELWREVIEVNLALTGAQPGIDMSSSPSQKKRQDDSNKENYTAAKLKVSTLKVPKSNWVYQTPPNRKLNFKKVKIPKEDTTKAVILSQKQMYQLKSHQKHIFETHQHEITLDPECYKKLESSSDDDPQEDTCDLERYFLNLSCRPKKRHNQQQARFLGEPKPKKRDMFDVVPYGSSAAASSSSSSSAVVGMEMDVVTDDGNLDMSFDNFDFVQNSTNFEESFTFKFTPSKSSAPGPFTVGQLFDKNGSEAENFNFCCD